MQYAVDANKFTTFEKFVSEEAQDEQHELFWAKQFSRAREDAGDHLFIQLCRIS